MATAAPQPTPPKQIKLRFPGRCRECDVELAKGTEAIHFKEQRKVSCLECWATSAQTAVQLSAMTSSPAPAKVATPLPGSSAQNEFDRRHQKREDELIARWGRAGKAIAWWQDDPQSTRAWSKGAKGEREAGLYLEKKLRPTNCEILHDRLIPGSRANIDHVVIGPAGVTILDTKNYKGKVRSTRVGFGRSRRTILTVNGQDKTKLIEGVRKQVAAVEAELGEIQQPIAVPVAGGLLWWNHEGLPLLGEVKVDEVSIFSPKASYKFASRPGLFSSDQIGVVAIFLDSVLRPAA
ncbi:MAG: nuclease-related domain-containing protein [Solirubrobacterales bacterium]